MRRRVTACLLTVLVAIGAHAGAKDDAGLRSVFARGAGERALAMGGAYGSLADDATAAFWNPAGLGSVQRLTFQAAHTNLVGLGFYEQYGVLAVPSWRLGTVGLSLRRFGVDGLEGRDDRGGVTEADLDDAENELAVSYGRSLGDAWSVGATLKYQQQSLAGYKGGGVGMDAGVLARPFLAGGADSPLLRSLTLGLALRNIIEPNVRLLDEDVPDPLGLRFGSSLSLPLGARHRLTAAADLEKTRDMDPRLHAGVELVLLDMLALRGGSNDGTLAAGAGVRWRDLTVDYAFEDNLLESVHRIGLRVAFGPTNAARRQADQARVEQELQQRLDEAFRSDSRRRLDTLKREAAAAILAGDHDGAMDRVRTLRVLAPDEPGTDKLEAQARRLQAATAEAADDLAGAALAYRRSLTLDPTDTPAREGLERVTAESDRRTARSQEVRTLYDEGMAAYTAGDLETARTAFTRITELAEGEEEASRLLDHIEEAIRTRDRVEAARSHAVALAAEARRSATTTPKQTTASPAAPVPAPSGPAPAAKPAAPTYESLPMRRRADIADLYRRGVEAADAGHRQEAVGYWELVWAAAPDFRQVEEHLKQEYLAQGMEAFAAGRLEQAIAIWEKALVMAPDDARVQGYLERAYEHQARHRHRKDSP
jgi:tetratricopeptide (TPR) repeat protein